MNLLNCKTLTTALALSTTLLAATLPASADTAYMEKTISVPHRDVPVKLDIYYPVEEGGAKIKHGKNIVFKGIEISDSTNALSGTYPVVLFSHGSGGNGINTGWFMSAIAEAGMIAIAPNHPGSTSRDSHPDQSLKTWERPDDISAIIDQLPELFAGNMKADLTRIAVTGFSLGGYTALTLGGVRASKAGFIKHCDASMGSGLNECRWFTKDGLDLNDINKDGFEGNNRDTRIKAIVSVDPGFAAAINDESLAAVDVPVKIINLGSPDTLYAGIDGSRIAPKIPGAEYHQVKRSSHFSFLGECGAMGPLLLAVTFDDPICTEHYGRDRGEIHAETARETVSFLKKHFALTN